MNNETLASLSTIYQDSANQISKFINYSNPDHFFVSQTVNLLNILTINKKVLNDDNLQYGLNTTNELMDKIDKIGVDKTQAESFFSVLQTLIPVQDDSLSQILWILRNSNF